MPVARPEPIACSSTGVPCWIALASRPCQPLPASWGAWLVSLSPEVAAAFWLPGQEPSLSPFPWLCSPISFIHNPQERGQGWGREGLSPGSGRGRGPGALLTAEASLTHPATHVPLYGQGFLSVLKGNCEKSRADSGCLAVSWQQAWQEVFLSPPYHLPSLLHRPPLSSPPCVLCCVSLKLPSQPLRSQQPGPSGASSFGAAQPAGPGGGGSEGSSPQRQALCAGTKA